MVWKKQANKVQGVLFALGAWWFECSKCSTQVQGLGVVFITDSQYKAKWVYLARYFIGRDLGGLMIGGVFLRVTPCLTPGQLPCIIRLLLQLLRTSKMCLLRLWGSLWW